MPRLRAVVISGLQAGEDVNSRMCAISLIAFIVAI
jgi:hypothetical protein